MILVYAYEYNIIDYTDQTIKLSKQKPEKLLNLFEIDFQLKFSTKNILTSIYSGEFVDLDNSNTHINKNTFIANFVTNTTSASPTTNATPETFFCDPFSFIANNSTGLLINNADVYTINIAFITTPYLRYYTQSGGVNTIQGPYFSGCARTKDQFNCYDFKKAVDEYIVQFGGNASSSIPFTVSSYAEIEIDDPDQTKFRNWVNWKLGLNLSFSDYFKMAEN